VGHRVRVTDNTGNNIPGIDVQWNAATGGGSVNPTTSFTNADGLANTVRTLGPEPGTNTTVASATLNGVLKTLTFTVVTQEGGPAQTVLVAGDDQDGTVGSILPQPLQVRVLDADGVPQSDVTVTWSIQRGEGSFTTGTTSQTNGSGVASATWRLGNIAGEQVARASAAGPVVIFDAVATPGPPNSTNTTLAASPTFFTAGSSTTITATVRDQFNNLVGGVNVNLSSNATGTFGDATLQTATSGANLGKASTSYTSSVAGNHTITAQIGAFNKTVVVAVQAATAGSKMAASTSLTGTATFGGSVTPLPAVLVTDQFDNPLANVPVSWSLIQGKGSVSFEAQTNSSGVSTVTDWTLDALSPGYDQAYAVVNQVRASAAVSTGSPVTFTRTVQVSFANVQTLFGTVQAATSQGTCLGSGCHVGPLALDLRPGNAYPDLIGGGTGFTYVTPSDSTTVSSSVNRLLFRLKGLGSQPMPTTSPPRGGTLPANIITIIAAWVRQGAPSP
jgi:adhesin/invasin